MIEKFKEFNEHLFWIAQEKPYQEQLNQKESERGNAAKVEDKAIANKFDKILTNEKKPSELKQGE